MIQKYHTHNIRLRCVLQSTLLLTSPYVCTAYDVTPESSHTHHTTHGVSLCTLDSQKIDVCIAPGSPDVARTKVHRIF